MSRPLPTLLLVALLPLVLPACAIFPDDGGPPPSTAPHLDEASAALAPAAWLTGGWTGEVWGGVMEEWWTPPRGGLMLGAGRLMMDGRAVFFEHLRLEARPEGLTYVAQPGGAPPTDFPARLADEQVLEFFAPEHDFPRLIRYERLDQRTLRVTLHGTEAGAEKSDIYLLTRI